MSSPSVPAALPSLYSFFGHGGLLETAYPAFEYRPGQLEMARAVERALEERRHLLVEAGTGTGKTLAYLVPALRSGRRVIVSTGTKNLQEQLVFKDIPLLEKALGRKLRVVCMKGRNNYACRQKISDFEQHTYAQHTLLTLDELDYYRRIRLWASQTESGDRAELDFLPESAPLWERLNARRETCTGQKCQSFETCFLTALHQNASEADLVVVNHHLFFADLTLKHRDIPGVLPPYEAVIFDEAHELEEVAATYFGVSASNYQADELARDTEALLRVHQLWSEALARRARAVRETVQHLLADIGNKEGRFAFTQRAEFREQHADRYERMMHSLIGLKTALEGIQDKPEEIHTLIRRVEDLKVRVAYLFESNDPTAVYWYERRGRGIFLQATPIDVAQIMRQTLLACCDTLVLTSATLAVGGNFDYVRDRIGIDDARERSVPSSFDFAHQALFYVPAHLPDARSPEFARAAAEEIEFILSCSEGRAFVLFTSYEQMRTLYAALETRLRYPMLLQGTAPRHILLERFRNTPNCVLFATSSFWQGVDVQGEQLSCVIIDRLPFASPGDPVIAARIRALNQSGRNAFMEFQVPQAVLTLKQGFGRLIRSTSDRGVIALLDTRILRQRYGSVFLNSLPGAPVTSNPDEVREFFVAATASRAGSVSR